MVNVAEGPSSAYHFIGLNYAYTPSHIILNDADLMIERGQLALILGDNGSGKTTLMKYISGLLLDSHQNLNGTVQSFLQSFPRKFFYFPDDLLFPHFTVEEYLFLSLQRQRIRLGNSYASFKREARHALEQSTIVASPKTLVSELSSGNRTLLRFLNLYLNEYDFLLLDEPSSHLDDQKVTTLIEIVKTYVTTRNCFCLVSSHDPRLTEAPSIGRIDLKYRLEGEKIVRLWD